MPSYCIDMEGYGLDGTITGWRRVRLDAPNETHALALALDRFKTMDKAWIVEDPRMVQTEKPKARPLYEIARDIRKNWPTVSPFARPYLDAMQTLTTINENYGADDGRGIVAYFLSNATGWRGPEARRIKAELNLMLK